MICEECKKEGIKSTISIGSSMSTLMHGSSGYDEDGRYYIHDPNIITTSYHCSRGHVWDVKREPLGKYYPNLAEDKGE